MEKIIDLISTDEKLKELVTSLITKYQANVELTNNLAGTIESLDADIKPIIELVLATQNKQIEHELSNPGSAPINKELETFIRYAVIDIITGLDILNAVGIQPIRGPVETLSLNGNDETMATAESRKLKSSLSIESMQDVVGTKLAVDQIRKAFAEEVSKELTGALLTEIANNVTPLEPIDIESVTSQSILDIAAKKGLTHLWVSPSMLPRFVNIEANGNDTKIGYVGTIGVVKVHVLPQMNNTILLSKKGSNQECGLLYCPYTLLLSSGVIFDMETASPKMSFITRHAIISSVNINDFYTIIPTTSAKSAE